MDVGNLFHRLLHAFDAPEPPPLPEMDEKLALGALLVRAALSDHQYAFAEIKRIDRLLSRLFDLGPIEAAKMRATCERIEKSAPDHVDLAHLIQATVRMEARLDALEAMWEVALADGGLDPAEAALLEDVRKALGLRDEDGAEAQRRAAEAMEK
ncbi:MAG: TerB family tellurite resistance protein [Pseudomonadota bacterium]